MGQTNETYDDYFKTEVNMKKENFEYKLENILISGYYEEKEAADYLDVTEEQLEAMTEFGILISGISVMNGQTFYSIDELDKVGKTILFTKYEIMDSTNSVE